MKVMKLEQDDSTASKFEKTTADSRHFVPFQVERDYLGRIISEVKEKIQLSFLFWMLEEEETPEDKLWFQTQVELYKKA